MTNNELADKIAGLKWISIFRRLSFVVLSTLVSLYFIILIVVIFSSNERLAKNVLSDTAKRIDTITDPSSIQILTKASTLDPLDFMNEYDLEIGTTLILLLLHFYVSRFSRIRRKVFLRNFKKEDVASAPQCSIQRTERLSGLFKKREKLNNWTGSIFEVREQKNVFVIFNESPFKVFERMLSKTRGYRVGVLLNYEGHHFFYCSSWIPNFNFDA